VHVILNFVLYMNRNVIRSQLLVSVTNWLSLQKGTRGGAFPKHPNYKFQPILLFITSRHQLT